MGRTPDRAGLRAASLRRPVVLVASVALLLVPGIARAPSSPAAPTRSELEAAKVRLLEIERDFQLVSERYNAVNARLVEIQAEMAGTDLDVRELSSRIAVEQDAAIALARSLYMNGGSATLEAALSASDLNDLERRYAYLEAGGDAHREVFEGLAGARKLLETRFGELEAARDRIAAGKARMAELHIALQAKVDAQRAEIERLNEVIAAAERAAAARRTRLGARPANAYEGDAARFVGRNVQPDAATNPQAQAALDYAMAQLGKPYQWGAQGPDRFDCSGLTMMAWAAAGVTIPRVSYVQFAGLPHVDRAELEPGDLVFFGSPIHHVAMYIGRGLMIEAPYTGSYVRINSVDRPDYVGAARPTLS